MRWSIPAENGTPLDTHFTPSVFESFFVKCEKLSNVIARIEVLISIWSFGHSLLRRAGVFATQSKREHCKDDSTVFVRVQLLKIASLDLPLHYCLLSNAGKVSGVYRCIQLTCVEVALNPSITGRDFSSHRGSRLRSQTRKLFRLATQNNTHFNTWMWYSKLDRQLQGIN